MKLSQALGLTTAEPIAFVGAGGKTSAIETLVAELEPPVVLTTTTHLGKWQTSIAQQHIFLSLNDQIQAKDILRKKSTLITGPPGDGDRLTGLNPETLERLFQICCEIKATLLIEGDGAGQRPLKAPAEYEPVIPAWVKHVVVLAGLDGLGAPLDTKAVHRPELFSQITGLCLDEKINIQHMEGLLRSPQGGLKGIPKGARRVLFLNQAEGAIRKAQGARLANALKDVFDRVLIGSLHEPEADGPIFCAHSQTAGIVLAAGGSDRFGNPKQLLDWCGSSFVVKVAQTALIAGLEPVIVVTGAHQAEIETELKGLPVVNVFNPAWAEGQSSSMKAGLNALPENCDSVMFLLSDQPQISPLLIRQIIERYSAYRKPITAPMMRERRGNPVLFARETFDELKKICGDKGGRAIFNTAKVDYLDWIDDRDLLDVDQESDLISLKELFYCCT